MAWDSSSPVVDPQQQRPSVQFLHGLLALSLLFSGACNPEPARSLQDNEARLQFLGAYEGEPFQAEWAPDSEQLVFEGYDGGIEQGIYVVSREGGTPERVHTFESDQIFSGMSVSPDFRWAAYIAPAPDGYFQVFRAPMSGGPAEQLTFDPADKTQPAYSPDGEQLAFTVFSYLAHFWLLQESDE